MWKWLILVSIFGLLTFGCVGTALEKQAEQSVNDRVDTFSRASAIHPLPRTENFPLRQALVKFTEREDLVNHPWYTYILGENGNVVGYYITQTPSVNSCNFLSSTESIGGAHGDTVLTAPSLDGIYYGGGGTSSGCDEWFFFDQTTDALIKIRGVHFYTADQPLRLEAEPITVTVK